MIIIILHILEKKQNEGNTSNEYIFVTEWTLLGSTAASIDMLRVFLATDFAVTKLAHFGFLGACLLMVFEESLFHILLAVFAGTLESSIHNKIRGFY